MSRVSVVIPNYNGREILLNCLDSLRYGGNGPFETIVVDGASTDGSRKAVEKRFPGVVWIALKKNMGFAAAVNEGIRASSGEFILLLNNDTTVAPGFVGEMLAAIEADPSIGSADAKRLRMEDPSKVDSAGLHLNKWGHAFQIGRFEEDRGQFDEPREIFGVSGGSAIYRKRLFDDVGLFDESFESYFEDVDIAFRARWAGWKSVSAPRAVVLHKGGATSAKMPEKLRLLVQRNMIGYRIKNLPASILLPFLCHRILGDAYWIMAFAANRSSPNLKLFFHSRLMILQALPGWLRERRRIMKSRRVEPAEITRWMGSPGLPSCAYQGM